MEPLIIGGGLLALGKIFGDNGKAEQNRQIESV